MLYFLERINSWFSDSSEFSTLSENQNLSQKRFKELEKQREERAKALEMHEQMLLENIDNCYC